MPWQETCVLGIRCYLCPGQYLTPGRTRWSAPTKTFVPRRTQSVTRVPCLSRDEQPD